VQLIIETTGDVPLITLMRISNESEFRSIQSPLVNMQLIRCLFFFFIENFDSKCKMRTLQNVPKSLFQRAKLLRVRKTSESI